MKNIQMIDINKIHNHPDNPRKDVGDVSELAASIKQSGIMQNMTVVPFVSKFNPNFNGAGHYTVIIGHRRLAAAIQAGLKELPCAVVEMSEKEQVATMLAENMQRVDLTVAEEVQGIQMLLDLGDSVNDITKLTGFSESKVRSRVKLGKIPEEHLKKCKGGSILDYVKIAELEDEKDRKEALNALGTSNFNYVISSISNRISNKKSKAEWLEVIESFAEPTRVTSTKKYVAFEYYSHAVKDFRIPADKDTVKYYYEDCGTFVRIYRDFTAEEAEESARENAQRKKAEDDREHTKKRLEELGNQFEKLRWDFVKSYTGEKAHAYDLLKFLIDYLFDHLGYQSIDGKMELCELLKLYDDEDYTDSDEYQRILAKSPQKILLNFIALQVEDHKSRTYNWYGKYDESEKVTAYYRVLEKCGYEMADEEKAYYNGTHEAYVKEDEGDE